MNAVEDKMKRLYNIQLRVTPNAFATIFENIPWIGGDIVLRQYLKVRFGSPHSKISMSLQFFVPYFQVPC